MTDLDVNWDMGLSASVSGGAAECGRVLSNNGSTITNNGNQPVLQLFVKITGYPYTLQSSASGTNLLGADNTIVYSGCGKTQSNDWATQPYCFYAPYPVKAIGCQRCGEEKPALPGTSFSFTGGLTGSITYDGSLPYQRMILTDWVQPKAGVSDDELSFDVTLSHEKFTARTIHFPPFSCMPPDGMNPDEIHECAGCLIPLNRTLHCSIFGKDVTLSYGLGQDTYNSRWSGETSLDMECLGCDGQTTTGTVRIAISFDRLSCYQGQVNTGVTLRYISSFDQFPGPSSCSNRFTIMTLGSGYDYSQSTSCDPFLVTIDTHWYYRVNGVYGSKVVNFTLSE